MLKQLSEHVYAVLLHLYPASFRTTYGQQMCLTFRDACQAAYSRGGVGDLLYLWFPTLLDLFKSALVERIRQGELTMSKQQWMALAGPLTLSVGLLWMLASVGELVLMIEPSYADTFWDMFWLFPIFLSFLLMFPALIGTRLRYQETLGPFGRFGLLLSLVGCGGMFAFMLVSWVLGTLGIEQETWPNYVIVICLLSIIIGYMFFGMDALNTRPLPRGNVLPLLVAVPFLLLLIPGFIVDNGMPRNFYLTLIVSFLRFALTGLGWVLLGYAMLRHTSGTDLSSTSQQLEGRFG